MILGPNPDKWPEQERYLYHERVAIILEGSSPGAITEAEACRRAEAEVRASVEGAQMRLEESA